MSRTAGTDPDRPAAKADPSRAVWASTGLRRSLRDSRRFFFAYRVERERERGGVSEG
jgi:hypothetical protein